MKALALLALAATTALAACSPSAKQAPGNATTEGNVATTAEASIAPDSATAPAVASEGAPPKPGAFKTFKDWAVGCDNQLTCTMASLGPEAGDFPVITLALARDAGPNGGWRIDVQVNETGDKPPAPITAATVDNGQVVPVKSDAIGGSDAAKLIAAAANGNTITLRDKAGSTIETISLAGASAALRYIDAMQRRADTVTAVVAKGAKPASTVPAAPVMLTIAALNPSGPARSLPALEIIGLRKFADCHDSVGGPDPEYHALGGGKTLVMLACGPGTYNLTSAIYVIEEDGSAPLASTDAPSGFSSVARLGSSVINGDFDKGVLSTYTKARGLGDCGSSQEFVWDGDRFRLSKQEDMGECRGNPNYITTWQAHVVRR